MVQWFGLCASTVGGPGLISGWGTKVSQAGQHEPKKKQKNKKTEHISDEVFKVQLELTIK